MIDQVRPSELVAWFVAVCGSGMPVLLDVREPVEINAAHITPNGFELVCIPMGSLPARLSELDPSRPTACLCHHGIRSHRVAAFLAANNFEQVANVAGGIDAWARELDTSIARY